jgi:hypothetical protein
VGSRKKAKGSAGAAPPAGRRGPRRVLPLAPGTRVEWQAEGLFRQVNPSGLEPMEVACLPWSGSPPRLWSRGCLVATGRMAGLWAAPGVELSRTNSILHASFKMQSSARADQVFFS